MVMLARDSAGSQGCLLVLNDTATITRHLTGQQSAAPSLFEDFFENQILVLDLLPSSPKYLVKNSAVLA